MCYAAQIEADYQKLLRAFGPVLSLSEFTALWLKDKGKERNKVPKAVIDTIGPLLPAAAQESFGAGFRADEFDFQAELFTQKKRLADNERKLAAKHTKTAEKEVGIASRAIERLTGKLADLHRRELKARDWTFYPQWYAPVIIREGDGYVVKPMRYQLRKPGLLASSDWVGEGKSRRLSGTYNARRDNLGRYWRHQFGYTHGVVVLSSFFENVTDPDGANQRLQFKPRTGDPMFVACLWANWQDPEGVEPDMLCFAAITDDPEPEVAAAGHDRTIINIKPEHIEAWLNPDPANLDALYRIFDDKRHPFYEHRIAA